MFTGTGVEVLFVCQHTSLKMGGVNERNHFCASLNEPSKPKIPTEQCFVCDVIDLESNQFLVNLFRGMDLSAVAEMNDFLTLIAVAAYHKGSSDGHNEAVMER